MELNFYDSIPFATKHILKSSEEILESMEWIATEIKNRKKYFGSLNCSNIDDFKKLKAYKGSMDRIPYLVFIIDEYSDVINFSSEVFENLIIEIANEGMAVGIYPIISTSIPSITIISDKIIKAFKTKIAFAVNSKEDSIRIIDEPGAEELKENADMLISVSGEEDLIHAKGFYLSDEEISERISMIHKLDL